MLVNDFSGGLNLRTAPRLLNLNEATILTNADGFNNTLKPLKQSLDISSTEPYIGDSLFYYNEFLNTWRDYSCYSPRCDYRSVVKAGNYYWNNTGYGILKEGNDLGPYTYVPAGIPIAYPPVSAVEGSSGVLTGTYQYCYTFYRDTDGVESKPSDFTAELMVTNKQIDIEIHYDKAHRHYSNKVRLYRLGGSLTKMTLVTEIDIDWYPGTTQPENITIQYSDNIDDLSVDGHLLDSFDNEPAFKGNFVSTYHFPMGLTLHRAHLFGFVENKLQYSKLGEFDYFPTSYYINFDNDITGLGAVGEGLLVFTKDKTYLVTGDYHETFSRIDLGSEQGCVSHQSIQMVKNTLVWVSKDGICTYQGGLVTVITKPKLGKLSFNVKSSCIHDEKYYLAFSNEATLGEGIFVLDFRLGMSAYLIDQPDVVSFWVHSDEVFYVNQNEDLFKLLASEDDRQITYKSPLLIENSLCINKAYKEFKIAYKGVFTLTIYNETTLIMSLDLSSENLTVKEIKIPHNNRNNYGLQVQLVGVGEIHEFYFVGVPNG
jgi:hypothetical protein